MLKLAMARRPIVLGIGSNGALPSVTIIVPTYNEEVIIEKMLQNTLKLNYPVEKMEILIVDSGSTDQTSGVVRRYLNDSRVRLITHESRKGWNLAVDDACRHASGDIIVFAGADVFYDTEAIRWLCMHFKDPHIGSVTGRQVLFNQNQTFATRMERDYRRAQEFLTAGESIIDQPFDIKGEILAVRKGILLAIMNRIGSRGSLDACVPLETKAQGYRLAYEHHAVYSEAAPTMNRDRFHMQIRRGKNLTESAMYYTWMMGKRKFGLFGTLILPYHIAMLTVMPWIFFAGLACLFAGILFNPSYILLLVIPAVGLLSGRWRTWLCSLFAGQAALAIALPLALTHRDFLINRIDSTRIISIEPEQASVLAQ
jgi:glycosyltransferase involved in cell wall biosynthesis